VAHRMGAPRGKPIPDMAANVAAGSTGIAGASAAAAGEGRPLSGAADVPRRQCATLSGARGRTFYQQGVRRLPDAYHGPDEGAESPARVRNRENRQPGDTDGQRLGRCAILESTADGRDSPEHRLFSFPGPLSAQDESGCAPIGGVWPREIGMRQVPAGNDITWGRTRYSTALPRPRPAVAATVTIRDTGPSAG